MDSTGGGNAHFNIPTISQTSQPNLIMVSPFPNYSQDSQPANQVESAPGPNLSNQQIVSPASAEQGNGLQYTIQPHDANMFQTPQQRTDPVANNPFQQNYLFPGQTFYPGIQAANHPPIYYQPSAYLPPPLPNAVGNQLRQPRRMPQRNLRKKQEEDEETMRKRLRNQIECVHHWSCINIILCGVCFGLCTLMCASECHLFDI